MSSQNHTAYVPTQWPTDDSSKRRRSSATKNTTPPNSPCGYAPNSPPAYAPGHLQGYSPASPQCYSPASPPAYAPASPEAYAPARTEDYIPTSPQLSIQNEENRIEHPCVAASFKGNAPPGDFYGRAVDRVFTLEDQTMFVENYEYASQVNFCPFCGEEAGKKMDMCVRK